MFQRNMVNGAMLGTLTDADLEKLGVDNEFYRRRILSEIQKLARDEL